eukprot:TRINITY_DN37294_c0_g1_i1.p1 TRINITY_DN37294_c0_g1~~TRINITY_DN37294_c0_g1_i1.p1  ORF type:complete len:384 (-),score=107.92 TRINITY_DN37294_c0_g1_i1:44-1195(-)
MAPVVRKRPAAAASDASAATAARSRSPRRTLTLAAPPADVLKGLKAFVLNLERRADRWARVSAMVRRELPWLEVERFAATDGAAADIPEAEVVRTWNTRHNARYGDYAEWVSDASGGGAVASDASAAGDAKYGRHWKWACDADAEDPAWSFEDHGDDTAIARCKETGQTLSLRRTDQRYLDGVELRLSAGERGCASSHRRVWQLAAERTSPTLVLEDDVKLCSPTRRPKGKSDGGKFSARLALALEKAPKDFDVLYLGWAGFRGGNLRHHCEEDLPQVPAEARGVLRAVEYVWTTVAYVLSPAGARKLLAAGSPVDQPVDNFMAWEACQRRLRSFVVLGEGDADELWNGGIADQFDFLGDSDIAKSDGGDQGDSMAEFIVSND